MKQLLILFFIVLVIAGCNTKQGTQEPTVDSRLNPAELPVDSVGASTDMADNAATDSNKTGDPMMPPGKSDLQVGGDDGTDKAISSDGNYVEGDKQKETGHKNEK
ncbi:MAG TPA: hypothetical protein VD908_08300 [Cytophagales bacterium]|nr:hypothetical protein [Cytophagales bacterium]